MSRIFCLLYSRKKIQDHILWHVMDVIVVVLFYAHVISGVWWK